MSPTLLRYLVDRESFGIFFTTEDTDDNDDEDNNHNRPTQTHLPSPPSSPNNKSGGVNLWCPTGRVSRTVEVYTTHQ